MSKIEAFAVVDDQEGHTAIWDEYEDAVEFAGDDPDRRIVRLIPEPEAATANGEDEVERKAWELFSNAYPKVSVKAAFTDAIEFEAESMSRRASRAAQPAMTEQEIADAIAREKKGGAK